MSQGGHKTLITISVGTEAEVVKFLCNMHSKWSSRSSTTNFNTCWI